MPCDICLASASPRRRELLKLLFGEFEVIPSDIPEVIPKGLNLNGIPEYLAKIKAQNVFERFPDKTVIGADTSVICDGTVLGKPKTQEDAYNMLSFLSGKTHLVITGCAVINKEKSVSFSEITRVTFYDLSKKEIADYIATGEPFDKAGGYGIQSKGALLVKEISGDYFNVVGLPVAALKRVIDEF